MAEHKATEGKDHKEDNEEDLGEPDLKVSETEERREGRRMMYPELLTLRYNTTDNEPKIRRTKACGDSTY